MQYMTIPFLSIEASEISPSVLQMILAGTKDYPKPEYIDSVIGLNEHMYSDDYLCDLLEYPCSETEIQQLTEIRELMSGELANYLRITDLPQHLIATTYPKFTGDYASFKGGSREERDAEIQRLRDLIEAGDFSIYNEAEIEAEIGGILTLQPLPVSDIDAQSLVASIDLAANTGGNILNDVITLKNGMIIRISEGNICIYRNEEADDSGDYIVAVDMPE